MANRSHPPLPPLERTSVHLKEGFLSELSPEQLLSYGQSMTRRKKFNEAIESFNCLLQQSPTHVSAWMYKGICFRDIGDFRGAVECFEKCIQIDQSNWMPRNYKGEVLRLLNYTKEALAEFGLALQVCMDESDRIAVSKNIAIVKTEEAISLQSSGEFSLSLEKLNQAKSIYPNYAPTHFYLGYLSCLGGDNETAIAHYMRALQFNPEYIEAFCNIGSIYQSHGDLQRACEFYRYAYSVNKDLDMVRNVLSKAVSDLGTQFKEMGMQEKAINCYKEALLYKPDFSHAWYNLGVTYVELQSFNDAILAYQTAIVIDPDLAEAYNNLGVIEKNMGNMNRSIMLYQKALQINPNFTHAINNLAAMKIMSGNTEEGEKLCLKAIAVDPEYGEAYNNLAILCREEGRIEESASMYEKAMTCAKKSSTAANNRLLTMNYSSHFSTDFVTKEHLTWAAEFQSRYPKIELTRSPRQEHIRVGYVSGDFCMHSVSYFIDAPLKFHDKSNFTVFCYANMAKEDQKTSLLKSYGIHWRYIFGKTPEAICESILTDEIDILVDLSGHTAANCLEVFAMKPAPIQISWIGYPNTTGLSTIDYRICDVHTDPMRTQQTYSEKLIRLRSSFLCYTPWLDLPPVSLLPFEQSGIFTFGSLNSLAKVTDEVISVWASILNQVKKSRIILKSKSFASDRVKRAVLQKFIGLGVLPHRIDLLPLVPDTKEHLSIYSQIDLALDTFPYSGTTTTCEAMVMGVPVITMRGNRHAQNVSASLLSQIPILSDFITKSPEAYVEKAVHFVLHPEQLKEIRSNLREMMLASELCNGESFTQNLEQKYLQICQSHFDNKS